MLVVAVVVIALLVWLFVSAIGIGFVAAFVHTLRVNKAKSKSKETKPVWHQDQYGNDIKPLSKQEKLMYERYSAWKSASRPRHR